MEEKTLVFYSESNARAFSFLALILSLLKPLRCSQVVMNLVTKDCYGYLNSLIPVIACVQDSMKFVTNTLSANFDKNAVHIDLDNDKKVGSLKFKLEKVFKGFKAFNKVKENYERIQKLLYKQSFIDFDDPDNLYVVETLNLIRNLLNEVYFFDDKSVRSKPNIKEYILANSKIDKAAHQHFLSTQIFSTFYAK